MKPTKSSLIESLWKESSLSARKMSCHFSQNHSMPIVPMDGKQIVYITTTEEANEYAKAIIDKFKGKEMVCYGSDAAWCIGDAANSTPFFQFSFICQ